MSNSIDDRALSVLMAESSDLHADSMRAGREQLDDYVEAAEERRVEQSRGVGKLALVGGAAGAAVLAGGTRAFASSSMDTQVLQTAAAIEVIAIQTYTAALGLPFIGGSAANGVVKTFAQMTMAQHKDHLNGFNSTLQRLGSPEQHKPDPKYAAYVKSQLPHLTDAGRVVALAIALEDVAAQTYTKNVSEVTTSDLRQMFAGVAGVEAQHKAILLAVQALIAGGAPQLIALPPDLAKLPKAAGSVGFPDEFYPTKNASPATEGAIK